ncbi:Phosphate carrier protein, mitochondrial [Hondaea fermentalgiana]|uniref:Phosphate carrier protein, mitochondrial n=1 Tax=Hondaea fermentalgiana TaxID=2315210 RepID=A0A2R5GUY6_9STRA|nr:Phosphate carrier protein, mitochondrial [Hondaea fermentalgiana]|eukprot:GBG34672.1 Phosphate carrier protein, mitochondrial [Hondaea fermentalgiana]
MLNLKDMMEARLEAGKGQRQPQQQLQQAQVQAQMQAQCGEKLAGVRAYSAQSAASTLAPLTAAAVSTAVIMYPVDVMRALTMASAGTKEGFSVTAHYQKHGVKGFVSKGVLPEIAKSTVMRVSKFFFFPVICNNLHGKPAKDCSVGQKAIAGALATVPEIIMISPLEVAKIGMQLDHENKFKNNSRVFIQEMYKTRGVGGLYVGWAGMQWRQCFWTGTFFATLQWWKNTVEPPMVNVGVPNAVATLVAGFLAGFFATFPNAPGDVVRSVVQKRVFADPTRPAYGISPAGVAEHITVAKEIVASSGIRGLYSGLGFKAMHLGGSGALMAVLVPFFSNVMGINYGGV